jgi:hypothetical protein
MDPITAVGDHTVAATLSLAGGITTMITDGTISTATTSAFIISTAAAFMVVAFTVVAGTTAREPERHVPASTQRSFCELSD